MGQPSLIARYLAELAGQLLADIVGELADGLAETRQALLSRGLPLPALTWPAAARHHRQRRTHRPDRPDPDPGALPVTVLTDK